MYLDLITGEAPDISMEPLVTITQMCEILDKSRITVYRWVKAKKLTAPIYRNNRTIGWCPVAFAAWQSNQV